MTQKVKPRPGQESVWDYPRPPRLERVNKKIVVKHFGEVIASTHGAYRVLETSHPPVYYIPQKDIRMEYLQLDTNRKSWCEWKGIATYWDLVFDGQIVKGAAWSYPDPEGRFEPIENCLAFYASKLDECLLDSEKVAAQKGDFYGGWITSNIVGPFKGAYGTWGW